MKENTKFTADLNIKEEKEYNQRLSSEFAIVIDSTIKYEFNERILTNQDIINYCTTYGVAYWFIEHKEEKILNSEGVLLKTKFNHFHLVIKFQKTRKRQITIINDISKYFDIPKVCISVQYASSIYAMIRYLIHLDNPEKEQYTEDMIYTNDRATMNYALNFNCAIMNTQDLIKAIDLSNGDTIKLMCLIGLGNYQKYWACIREILRIKYNK